MLAIWLIVIRVSDFHLLGFFLFFFPDIFGYRISENLNLDIRRISVSENFRIRISDFFKNSDRISKNLDQISDRKNRISDIWIICSALLYIASVFRVVAASHSKRLIVEIKAKN